MREIKFRAWDEADGYHRDTSQMSYDVQHNCDATEIMQYTGLKDKNGVEIYEGDIVRNITTEGKIEKAGVITWSETEWQWCEHYRVSRALNYFNYEPEVIGNIYENPEMVEKLNE